MCFAMTALVACKAGVSNHDNVMHFDTDSHKTGTDDRCSVCMSHDTGDFVGQMRDSNRIIKGFGGSRTKTLKCGTLLWKWHDSEGVEHKFKTPNSHCVPEGEQDSLAHNIG